MSDHSNSPLSLPSIAGDVEPLLSVSSLRCVHWQHFSTNDRVLTAIEFIQSPIEFIQSPIEFIQSPCQVIHLLAAHTTLTMLSVTTGNEEMHTFKVRPLVL